MFFSGKSDIGKRRATNQDSFSIVTLPGEFCLLTVCDGMGGANGGNVASELACSVYTGTVKNGFDPGMTDRAALLKKAVAAANTAVYEKAASDESLRGMGTTLVSALVAPDGSITAINVGDSRMYCIDGGELRQITRDHSYVQYLVDMGQLTISEAENASIKNIIIRSATKRSQTPTSSRSGCRRAATYCSVPTGLPTAFRRQISRRLSARRLRKSLTTVPDS